MFSTSIVDAAAWSCEFKVSQGLASLVPVVAANAEPGAEQRKQVMLSS